MAISLYEAKGKVEIDMIYNTMKEICLRRHKLNKNMQTNDINSIKYGKTYYSYYYHTIWCHNI